MSCLIALFIRKRIDDHQSLRRNDFAIDPLAPYLAAFRRSLAVVKNATWAEIQFSDARGEAFRPPPVFQMLRLGECLPHQLTRRFEDARDDELTLPWLGYRATSCFGQVSTPLFFSSHKRVSGR